MKRILTLGIVAAAIVVLCSSCGKRCWCYEAVGSVMTETETYVDDAYSCNSLSTPSRTCVEDAERMDKDQIAYK